MRRAAVGGEAANEGYRTQSSRFLGNLLRNVWVISVF